MEESLAKQKSRIQWLKEGDQNTKFFFKCIKGRQNKNTIKGLALEDDSFTDDKNRISEELVGSFKNTLTCPGQGQIDTNFNGLLDVPRDVAENMIKDASADEIKHTIFSMNDNKALGPDGLGAKFFKKNMGDSFAWMLLKQFNKKTKFSLFNRKKS